MEAGLAKKGTLLVPRCAGDGNLPAEESRIRQAENAGGGPDLRQKRSGNFQFFQDFRVPVQTVDIIKLNGSVELGPIVELGDVIVDIVETGSTLRENGLEVLEEICDLSARMIVNRVSMQIHGERIREIIAKLKANLENK